MTPIDLDSHTKARLITSCSEQVKVHIEVKGTIFHHIRISDNSDDLLAMLTQGQEAFADAIVVVMSELKIEPAKGNIDIVTIDQQGEYAKTAPNKPKE